MVTLTISTHVQPDKRDELWSTLQLVIDRTEGEMGCLDSRLAWDANDQNMIRMDQTWSDYARLHAYFRSDLFSALLGAVKLLGVSHAIRIDDGSEAEGREAVQRARSMDRL
jgi:quinol monooxygenase YgiN